MSSVNIERVLEPRYFPSQGLKKSDANSFLVFLLALRALDLGTYLTCCFLYNSNSFEFVGPPKGLL